MVLCRPTINFFASESAKMCPVWSPNGSMKGGVNQDRSTNWATTSAQDLKLLHRRWASRCPWWPRDSSRWRCPNLNSASWRSLQIWKSWNIEKNWWKRKIIFHLKLECRERTKGIWSIQDPILCRTFVRYEKTEGSSCT